MRIVLKSRRSVVSTQERIQLTPKNGAADSWSLHGKW